MVYPKNLSESDRHWFDLICECRASGKSDYQWLQENNISSPTFYYHIKQLRKKACDIPTHSRTASAEIQEVVPMIIEDATATTFTQTQTVTTVSHSGDPIAIRLNIRDIAVEITNSATQETIKNTLSALQFLC